MNLALATLSLESLKEISQGWKKGSERALERLAKEFSLTEWQVTWMKGYGRYLYLLPQKLAVGQGMPGDSRHNPGYSGQEVRTFRMHTRTLRVLLDITHNFKFRRYLWLTNICRFS